MLTQEQQKIVELNGLLFDAIDAVFKSAIAHGEEPMAHIETVKYGVAMKIANYWVKKIGDIHLGDRNATRCGKPMLGNNYAKEFREMDRHNGYTRKYCPTCFKLEEVNNG